MHQVLSAAGAMETESMGCARHLECRAVDPIPQKATVAQKEIQPSCSQSHGRKRQGKRKGVGRAAALWASALTSYAIAGTSLVGWHDPTIEHQLFCNVGQLQWYHGQQGREGERQAYEIVGCRFEAAQRRAPRRAAIPRQRGDGPQRPGGNEDPPLCGIAAREGQEGARRGTSRASPHAWRLEELLSAICGPVVEIHRTIHATGAPDDGTPQVGPGEPLGCKGKFGGVQVRCRPGVQGGVCAHERCRRHRTQRGRDIRRAKNCGKLSGLSVKSPNTTQASRASCADGSRARPDAQTTSDVHAGTVYSCKRRRWHAPVFWGARVNTFAPRIAPGQSHKCDRGGLMHIRLQPDEFPADCMPVTNASIFNPALKWNHSVLSETNFVDEWMAADLAFHLAHEIAASYECCMPIHASDTAMADFAQVTSFQSVQCFSSQGLYKDFEGACISHTQITEVGNTGVGDDASHRSFRPVQQQPDTPVPRHCEDSGQCLEIERGHMDHPPSDPLKLQEPYATCIDFAVAQTAIRPNHTCEPYDSGFPDVVGAGKAFMSMSVPLPHDPKFQPDRKSVLSHSEPMKSVQPAIPPVLDSIPSRKVVHFCSEIDLFIGCEDQWNFHHIRILEESLVMPCKPWSLTYPHSPQQNGPLQSDVLMNNSVTKGAYLFEPPEVLSHVALAGATRMQALRCHGKPNEDPVWSVDESQCQSGFPPQFISQCRLEHESPLGWMPTADGHDDDEDQDEHIPQNFDEEPALVRHLRDKFLQLGFINFDGDFEIPIRTWYLDHVTVRRWTAPRILQLVGPPHTWEQQFMSLWVDQIDPSDWFDVSIVHPDPPRIDRHSFVMLDVILTQSLHMDRYPGLVTVIPQQVESFEMFSVAYSFTDFISGFDVVLAADAVSMCRYHPCTITFGWDEIPHSLRPQHVMRPGDGFQVLVRPGRLQLAELIRSSSAASSSHAPPAQPSIDASVNLTCSTPEHPLIDDPAHRRFTTPLHLFQLDAHEVIVDLVNAQLAHPSHDIAEAADVPFDCVEAVHMLIARPRDFPELAIPAILQRTGDLPLHSTDRLILIDTVYHHQAPGPQVHNRPTVVRTVHRLPHQVIRPQILTAAAVYQYCQFLQETCEVVLDDRRWPPTEVEPRSLRHGSYARIDVPPPMGYDVDTMTAAAIVQTDADTDAFMDFLQDELDGDDATFLAQVTATRVLERPQICKVRSILTRAQLAIDPDVEGATNNEPTHQMHSVAPHEDAAELTDDCHVVPPSGLGVVHTNKTPMLSCNAAPARDQTGPPGECQLTPRIAHQAKQASLHQFFSVRKDNEEAAETAPTLSVRSSEDQQQPPHLSKLCLTQCRTQPSNVLVRLGRSS